MKILKVIIISFILCLAWLLASSYILTFLNDISYGFPDVDEEPYWYSFFFTCIWAPLWEEMMYRWAPIKFAKQLSIEIVWPVIIIASATFGWGHGDCPEGVFLQGVLGIIFSGVYLYTGKIWTSMLVHSMYNCFLFFLPALTNI